MNGRRKDLVRVYGEAAVRHAEDADARVVAAKQELEAATPPPGRLPEEITAQQRAAFRAAEERVERALAAVRHDLYMQTGSS